MCIGLWQHEPQARVLSGQAACACAACALTRCLCRCCPRPRRSYGAMVRAGITMVSIGHRPALRRFHSMAVHFGEGGPGHYSIEQIRGSDVEGLTEEDMLGV